MLADDNCVPMYNSALGDFNNYGNYISGNITFPTKECYSNLNFAFKNVYSSENTFEKQVIFERLGVLTGFLQTIDEKLEESSRSGSKSSIVRESEKTSEGGILLILVLLFLGVLIALKNNSNN